MQVDLADVVAEVTAAFERYEQALVTNDVATLDGLFHNDERTIRYGIAENLYGSCRGGSISCSPLAAQAGAHPLSNRDHHLWS